MEEGEELSKNGSQIPAFEGFVTYETEGKACIKGGSLVGLGRLSGHGTLLHPPGTSLRLKVEGAYSGHMPPFSARFIDRGLKRYRRSCFFSRRPPR